MTPQPAQRSRPQDFKPHVFGKFFLLQRLAVGGMAEIYRAKVAGAGGFEKEMVLKRILTSRAQDQGFVKMLVNEAKLTVQLTHNNIAQIYECGTIDGQYFIAMELVNGVTLKEMMSAFQRAGVTLTPEQSIYLVLQLLQGLDYAHKKTDPQGHPLKIVHCDVSPDNALISYQGEVKLLDFGIARAATGLSNYKEGMLMGKLGYVAPEQASLEKAWDHRVDIFAAGILLYELLTKQKPFPKATDVESLVQSRRARVLPPTTIDDRLPRDIDPILLRALAYDPEKRYHDARAFADALVDLLFPTPHSAIQDLLGSQMHQVYAERIAKQRQARAHDALVMKVLANVAAQQQAVYQKFTDTRPATPPLAVSRPDDLETPRPRVRTRTVRVGMSGWRAVLAGLVAGSMAAAGFLAAAVWLARGVVVVTSNPPGAEVIVDGKPGADRTPAVVEGLRLSQPHTVEIRAADRRAVAVELDPRPGELVRRVHGELPSLIGSITVESDPPGAEVRLDGRAVGTTPLTLPGIRVDQRHRIDLTLSGHEIDQFVVLPEKDGLRYQRKLAPARRERPRATRQE
ncbi:MAG TPA: serine/threonine-protein kinase [Anaeromyxobacteraceae bacterium]|nr:serine/threonine-protein kinase [Anaeromyxobacteraceae bacterium]